MKTKKQIDKWIDDEISKGHYDDCATPFAPMSECTGDCLCRRYRDMIDGLLKLIDHYEEVL